jgi:L-aminopeptidase/D-esterase-like protein
VVLCPSGGVPGVDARGGAPGTRETDCLRPENVVPVAHAVFLTGGSAYGLDCASGIMRWLEERGVGFRVGPAVVPIVAGAVIFDLAFAEAKCRPDAQMGYEACRAAGPDEHRQGNVGAGTGANIGRLSGNPLGMVKGGLGTASIRVGELVVGAIVVANCNGNVTDPETGEVLAGTLTPDKRRVADAKALITGSQPGFVEGFPTGTAIGVVATNARLTKDTSLRVAIMAQDGYARVADPVHTLGDGDVVFCLGAGTVEADVNRVGSLAAWAIAGAAINGVRSAVALRGVPSWKEINARG